MVRIQNRSEGFRIAVLGKAIPEAARFISNTGSATSQREPGSPTSPAAAPSDSALDKLKNLFKRRPQ